MGKRCLRGTPPGPVGPPPPRKRGGKGCKRGRVFTIKPSGRPRVFDGEVEQAILADLRQGMATKDAAARHGCSEDTVRRIRRRNADAQQE
nr:MAG TPA: putative terminase small subunit [Caudoviricetes sp.]